MSVSLHELVKFADNLLEVDKFADYCPNGLQIECSKTVSKIVTGVTASEALIDAAIHQNADAIFVHHGYFWKGENPVLVGMKGRRIKKLLQNEISLIAYHLPLDAHPVLGNNRQLANILDFSIGGGLDDGLYPIGFYGHLSYPMTGVDFCQFINDRLQREPVYIGDTNKKITSVAWCTGAAQSYMDKAVSRGVDCFVTGEVSEQTVHIARETGVSFISAGHHATERYGIKALGEFLAEKFNIANEFIDIPNPI